MMRLFFISLGPRSNFVETEDIGDTDTTALSNSAQDSRTLMISILGVMEIRRYPCCPSCKGRVQVEENGTATCGKCHMTVSGKSTSYSVHFLAQGREQQSYEMTAFETTILAAFPDIPQLQGLTQVEEILISAVMPMMSLYRLPLGQYGYSGHVVNLPQDISTFVTSTTAGSN